MKRISTSDLFSGGAEIGRFWIRWGGPFFQAVALNNEARMAGSTSDPSGKNALAAVWEPSGKGLVLGTVDGDPGSIALGINDRGVVVGGSGAVSFTSAAAYNQCEPGTYQDAASAPVSRGSSVRAPRAPRLAP